MHPLRPYWTVLAFLLIATLTMALPADAQQTLRDNRLYTLYSTNQSQTQVSWLTCGRTPQSGGCYGTGILGPFADACAIVQSAPTTPSSDTVVRYIYILDSGSGPGGATLTAYRRTDTVTPSNDVIQISTVAVVPLPILAGGPGATCLMAQNPTNVYTGTTQGVNLVTINKGDFTVTSGRGTANMSALTADSNGFVTVAWGSGFAANHVVFGPDGNPQLDGGGIAVMSNAIDAVHPSN